MDASRNSSILFSQIRTLQSQLQDLQTQLEGLPATPSQQQLTRSMSDLCQQLNTFAVEGITPVESRPSEKASLIPGKELDPGLVELLPIGVFITNEAGENLYLNPHYRKILGYSIEEMLGHGWLNSVHPDDRDRIFSPWIAAATTGYTHCDEYRVITAQGEIHCVRAHAVPILNAEGEVIGHTGTIEDITQQKQAEEQLKETLEEKEALLKEVHHRVKNNLQVISSLLYLQSQRIEDARVRQFLNDSQSRISSMALVHDTLYRSQDFAHIDLSEYIQTLTTHLFHTYRIQPDLIKLDLQIDAGIIVDIDQAIPCGLILNELMTNALKHGFSGGQTGHIKVMLQNLPDQVCLVVGNDGQPLPESFEFEQSQSMGLRLVNSLVHQLRGEVQVARTQTTEIKITFRRI